MASDYEPAPEPSRMGRVIMLGRWVEMPPRGLFERIAERQRGKVPELLKAQRLLAAGSCLAHAAVGLAILFRFGATGNSAAWPVLADFWSDFGSPLAFLVIAVCAAVGFFKVHYLRLSLYLGAVVMLVWAAGLALAWYLGYGAQPSCIWIAWIGVLKYCAAEYGLRYAKQTAAIDQLSSDVARTVHRSERGHPNASSDASPP